MIRNKLLTPGSVRWVRLARTLLSKESFWSVLFICILHDLKPKAGAQKAVLQAWLP